MVDDVKLPVYREVYVPSDDTYLLIDLLDIKDGELVLEVGCGCGIISVIAVLRGARRVVAVDVNPYAVLNTRDNVVGCGVYGLVDVIQSYGCRCLALRPCFDVVVFNPPYLPQEKVDSWIEVSWAGGSRGYDVLLDVLNDLLGLIKCCGKLYVVVSSLSGGRELIRRVEGLGLRVSRVRCKRMFFEEICAVEFTRLCG